ncbi:hypothetical protein [Bifidobacterium crudilactis]|jgi:hypothetical protein|uniref:hypothetical protein n=1 Tax=Bifidobacterium crudilactis TaxID=327277 RepID=UPI00138E429D|nr:hypothetical protein [Bifidobacterium crudilactis]MCI2149098.1 hypothetical protein [Bifidobacterium crudilactis]MCI2157943.1 hypothetical protein [Bifidobacterium crudilactis]
MPSDGGVNGKRSMASVRRGDPENPFVCLIEQADEWSHCSDDVSCDAPPFCAPFASDAVAFLLSEVPVFEVPRFAPRVVPWVLDFVCFVVPVFFLAATSVDVLVGEDCLERVPEVEDELLADEARFRAVAGLRVDEDLVPLVVPAVVPDFVALLRVDAVREAVLDLVVPEAEDLEPRRAVVLAAAPDFGLPVVARDAEDFDVEDFDVEDFDEEDFDGADFDVADFDEADFDEADLAAVDVDVDGDVGVGVVARVFARAVLLFLAARVAFLASCSFSATLVAASESFSITVTVASPAISVSFSAAMFAVFTASSNNVITASSLKTVMSVTLHRPGPRFSQRKT